MNGIPLARTKDIITLDLQDEILIYDLKINRAFSLNKTSTRVWRACNGVDSPEVIAFKTEMPLDLVSFALAELDSMKLLEVGIPKNKSMSRRAMVEMGISAGIVLPMAISLTAPMAAAAQSIIASCGNGFLEAPEACDDGNLAPGDGCDASCQIEPDPVCGNNIVEGTEQCDDGNLAPGDGCDSFCNTEPDPVCGNNIVEGTEQCDDGNLAPGDGCSVSCQIEPPPPDPVCGNNIVEGTEQCDDGNTSSLDGCDAFCNIEP